MSRGIRPAVTVYADAAALARGAADLVTACGRDAISARGAFTLALAGGSTPRRTYDELAARPDGLDAARTWFAFGDERCVGPDHDRSNYRMVREALLDPLGAQAARVLRLEGEIDPAAAARRYETRLRAILPEADPRLDLVLLGIGADGHTASLFPGTAALDERERWVVENWIPQLGEWRLTLTLPALDAARRVAFLVSGADKAAIVAEAFGDAAHDAPHPCERVRPAAGLLDVLLDAPAAARLGAG